MVELRSSRDTFRTTAQELPGEPVSRSRKRFHEHFLVYFFVALMGLFNVAGTLRTFGQDNLPSAQLPDMPLYEAEPHDAITLTADQGGRRYKIFTLVFPDTKVPASPQPDEKLRVRLLDQPDRQYDVAWRHIAKFETFSQLILNEANDLVAANEFDKAFKYFAYLRGVDANLPNLDESIERFIQQDARIAIRDGRLHESLSLLDELYRLNPRMRGLERTVISVTDQLFDGYLTARNYVAARAMLDWAEKRFGNEQIADTLKKWQSKLDQRAALRLKQAQTHLANNQMREAFDAGSDAQQISPDLPGVRELMADVTGRYIAITVGVSRRANPNRVALERNPIGGNVHPIGEDWASRRVRRLLDRHIAELTGIGPDGGRYVSPLATFAQGDDGRSIIIKLRRDLGTENASFNGFEVAENLLAIADTTSSSVPLWSELVNGISVRDVFDVSVELRRSFLRPEALLQFPWVATSGGVSNNGQRSRPYTHTGGDANRLYFRLNDNYALRAANQPQDVTEQYFRSTASAIQAFTNGEIDLIERIYPDDLDLARATENLVVEKYAIPSLHMLIPNFNRPLTANRTFRRAVVYGIDRKTLLEQDLLGGSAIAGCRLISGPFPAGRFDDDSLGYAYDPTLSPRPYEPRLAVTLSEIAFQESANSAAKAGDGSDPSAAPTRHKLRLLHPDDEIPRIASAGIAQYLTAVGIQCDAIAMPPGENWPQDNDWDLLYYDMVMAEPLLDAHRLLGAQGICGGGSAYLELALRHLATASNWAEAREQLHRIHYLVRQEAAIIPLWQLTEHFAYSPTIRGIEPEPVLLYERIESWQVQRAGK